MFRQPPGLSRNLIKNRYDIDFAKHWPVPVGLRFPSKTVLRMTCRAVASGPLLVRQLRDAHILLPRWGRAVGRNQLWVDPGRGLSGADRTIPRQFDRTLFGRGQDSHAEIAEPGAEIAEKNFIKPLAEHRLSERWHGRGNFSACSAPGSAISAWSPNDDKPPPHPLKRLPVGWVSLPRLGNEKCAFRRCDSGAYAARDASLLLRGPPW